MRDHRFETLEDIKFLLCVLIALMALVLFLLAVRS
jgi:hypothetical protein